MAKSKEVDYWLPDMTNWSDKEIESYAQKLINEGLLDPSFGGGGQSRLPSDPSPDLSGGNGGGGGPATTGYIVGGDRGGTPMLSYGATSGGSFTSGEGGTPVASFGDTGGGGYISTGEGGTPIASYGDTGGKGYTYSGEKGTPIMSSSGEGKSYGSYEDY
jgi:hypothetical protein